jgi:choline kinase
MTAVILAAGIASRLRPITDTMPKCLLRVGGTPLIERTLVSLSHAAIRRAIIIVGYRHEQIRAFVAHLRLPFPVLFIHNASYDTSNNNYSLWLAASDCAGRPMLLLDSDILFHPEIIRRVLASPHEDALAVRESRALTEEEIKVAVAADGRVIRIGKDIPPAEAAGESIGIERFSPGTTTQLFRVLSRRKDADEFYEAAFQELIDGGTSMHIVPCGTLPCIEIDTPADVLLAERLSAEIDG